MNMASYTGWWQISLLFIALQSQVCRCYTLMNWRWDSSSGDDETSIEPSPTGEGDWVQLGRFSWTDKEPMLPKDKRGKACIKDIDCPKSQFCHQHFYYCDRRRYSGELCRRNDNCLGDLLCMWGRCMKQKKPGIELSRCKRDQDCKPGLCCAREHGESVCKKYLTEGEQCYVSEGGVAYSIHHSCPCGKGLICMHSSPRSIAKGWQFSVGENYKCIKRR